MRKNKNGVSHEPESDASKFQAVFNRPIEVARLRCPGDAGSEAPEARAVAVKEIQPR